MREQKQCRPPLAGYEFPIVAAEASDRENLPTQQVKLVKTV